MPKNQPRLTFLAQAILTTILALADATAPGAAPYSIESQAIRVQVEADGRWSLLDKMSGVRWPSVGTASIGAGAGLDGNFSKVTSCSLSVRLSRDNGVAVVLEIVDDGRSLEIRYEGKNLPEIRLLEDALAVTDREQGAMIVPCREGLWIPANSGVAFRHEFGTSEYEGCHMNMLGVIKHGAALVLTWDDAYVSTTVESTLPKGQAFRQRITTSVSLRSPARSVRLTPLGNGDWNTIAAGYRRIARQKGLAVTLDEKIRRNPHAERLLGAANVKLWFCLERRMNEESTKEELVKVHWTFAETAQVAEHLKRDLQIDRCLFILGGWTEGGYDCRHPDNLPANPECGGNEALATAIRRIQSLGYVASLHDNYADMYRDAKSWNQDYIEKRADGSLVKGGRWLGGQSFIVCASKQIELAMRPQNLPEISKLFGPWSYFIDTTYAVGPQECADPRHPISRNDDIALKIELSDKARALFGLFGSECGREWALPHSDFFEGLVGVAGKYFHGLKPESLGATVIPFWEMVYHDCQICYGKYGYATDRAAEYVAHHVLCARPLNYHSIPDHLYWIEPPAQGKARPGKASDSTRLGLARSDQGWASGMNPVDVFMKNTHEVLGPLHLATAHQRLTRLEFLTPDGSLRRAVYGDGDETTTVVVNFGPADATVDTRLGGQVLLPKWGFVVESPKNVAFHAKRWNGVDYPEGALFTLQSVDSKNLRQAANMRIFHGFGHPEIAWKGRSYKVAREDVVAAGS
jgi:hypothetical protein